MELGDDGLGRRFTGRRRVRLGDVSGDGRTRFDALARYLQDIAADDAADAGLGDGWVLRRLTMLVIECPRFRDTVDLVTWCSGIGASAAERRTTVWVEGRVAVEAEALWVFVGANGRPTRLDPSFFAQYGVSADGRRVSTRLCHRDPPAGARTRPWPLRAADYDVLHHVNNAVSLAAVEDAIAGVGRPFEVPARIEVEYRSTIDPGDAPELVSFSSDDLECWLVCDGDVRVSARLGSTDSPVLAT